MTRGSRRRFFGHRSRSRATLRRSRNSLAAAASGRFFRASPSSPWPAFFGDAGEKSDAKCHGLFDRKCVIPSRRTAARRGYGYLVLALLQGRLRHQHPEFHAVRVAISVNVLQQDIVRTRAPNGRVERYVIRDPAGQRKAEKNGLGKRFRRPCCRRSLSAKGAGRQDRSTNSPPALSCR